MQALAALRGRCPSTCPSSTCNSRHCRPRTIIQAVAAPHRQTSSSNTSSSRRRPAPCPARVTDAQAQPLRSSSTLDSTATSISTAPSKLPLDFLDTDISVTTAGGVVSSVVPFRSPSRQGAPSSTDTTTLPTPAPRSPTQRQQQETAGAMASAQTVQQQVAAGGTHPVLGCSAPLKDLQQVRMQVQGTAQMGISFWPAFSFTPPARHPEPGTCSLLPPTAAAAAAAAAGGSRLVSVKFTQDPPDEFHVGANFLGGIPFPFILIRTSKLEGTVDCDTGAVVLDFEAQFVCGWGEKPPTSLTVNTQLTTEPAQALGVRMQGKRLRDGVCELVAAATVPKTGYWLADLILRLPTAAYARLPTRLTFLSEPVPQAAAAAGAPGEGRVQAATH